MSLNWDLTKIRDYEELLVDVPATDTEEGGKRLDGLTEAFIWMTMSTGLDKGWILDEAFAPEFYARLKLLEKIGGPIVRQGGEPYSITPEDVQRRIGLQTNAGSKTRAQFLKSIQNDLDSWKREYERETKKEEQAA